MRQRQNKFASLVSMMTVLWSICQGCPSVSGPTCTEELPNANRTTNHLKKSLRDLLKIYVDEGYGFREFTGPVCILENNGISGQPADLDTVSTALCQYVKCFQHFSGNIKRENGILPQSIMRKIEYSHTFLGNLVKVIEKMKQPLPLCTTDCRVTWFMNNTWEEITKGYLLAQELLAYLEQFNFLTVETANSICST